MLMSSNPRSAIVVGQTLSSFVILLSKSRSSTVYMFIIFCHFVEELVSLLAPIVHIIICTVLSGI